MSKYLWANALAPGHMGMGPCARPWAQAMGPCACVEELKLWPISTLTFGPISIFHLITWARAACRGKHLTKKRTLEKRSTHILFVFFGNKKMRHVRTILFAAGPCRDLWHVSENEGFSFGL